MAIESKLQLTYEGLPNPVEVAGGYSRIVGFSGAAFQEEHIFGTPQAPSVDLRIRDWASKEAAEKVYEPEREELGEDFDSEAYDGPGELSFETRKRLVGADYDSKNPEHVAQYEAAGSPDFSELDAHGNPWMPTVEEGYRFWFLTTQVYRGKTALPHIRERTVKLPVEIALQVVTHTVPGKNPQDNFETLASELYRAAMLSGAFVEPKVA